MSKVGEYYKEMDEINGTNDIPEPSDEELKRIEQELSENLPEFINEYE